MGNGVTMPNTATINAQYTIGGIAFSGSSSQSAEGQIGQVVSLAAGVAGAISSAGVDGLATGHGISGSDVIDVHWTDPSDGSHKCRRGLTVDTANANDIEFDETPAGEGDSLPAEDTACVVSVQTVVTCPFDGDLLLMIAAKSTQIAVADFRDAGGSELVLTFAANGTWSWETGKGFSNPVASDDIVQVKVSNGSTTAATFYLGILYDSVT